MQQTLKQVVQLRLTAPDSDAVPWDDLEFRSQVLDPRNALEAYLRRTFGTLDRIHESRDGVFTVIDPIFPPNKLVRQYRLKPCVRSDSNV